MGESKTAKKLASLSLNSELRIYVVAYCVVALLRQEICVSREDGRGRLLGVVAPLVFARECGRVLAGASKWSAFVAIGLWQWWLEKR